MAKGSTAKKESVSKASKSVKRAVRKGAKKSGASRKPSGTAKESRVKSFYVRKGEKNDKLMARLKIMAKETGQSEGEIILKAIRAVVSDYGKTRKKRKK